MKLFFTLLFIFGCLPVWGQVGVISVTDASQYTSAEDFYHTFEYQIQPLGKNTGWKKCQAKTSKNFLKSLKRSSSWFATAAHCVLPCAQSGCNIYMDLLDEDYTALAMVKSTPKKPAVFIHPDYKIEIPALDDFALIRLDLHRASYSYFRRVPNVKPGEPVSKQTFDRFLNKNRRAASKLRRVLSGDLPPILTFDDATYQLDRKLSVISIFDGVRDVKPNPNAAYYVNDLGFGYTKNFGIRNGMSGSGVMSNTGELVGMVSANLYVNTDQTDLKTGKTKAMAYDFFLFSAFNKPMRSFMEKVMGSDYYQLDFKDAYPQFVRKGSKADHTVIRSIVKEIRKKASSKKAK